MVGHYKVGQPYKIKGRWYRPEYDPSYSKVGTASWYGADFHGLPTANGEVFDKEQISAAHPTLPLPSIVRVTNLENGRSLDIRVNDRGPFIGDRLIDLSEAAARELGYEDKGLARCRWISWRWPTMPAAPRPRRPWPDPRRGRRPCSRPRPRSLSHLRARSRSRPSTRRRCGALRSACASGPQLVQIGAFGETDQVSAAMANGRGPGAGPGRARLRRRPGAWPGSASAPSPIRKPRCCCLERVVAMGYTDAFMVPASGTGRAALVSC